MGAPLWEYESTMRQRWILSLAALAALGALIGLGRATAQPGESQPVAAVEEVASAMPSSWLQFRLNDAHNPVISAPASAAWHVETGGQISASPTVVDNVVYVGTNGGILYAIDASSGEVLWKHRAKNGLKSNPLVYEGVLPSSLASVMPIRRRTGPVRRSKIASAAVPAASWRSTPGPGASAGTIRSPEPASRRQRSLTDS